MDKLKLESVGPWLVLRKEKRNPIKMAVIILLWVFAAIFAIIAIALFGHK